MRIRHTEQADLPRMLSIYARARAFMAGTGNPNQWGPIRWPPEALLKEDIRAGHSYVCLNEAGRVVGTFFFIYGEDIEPTYRTIYDGAWRDPGAYGVVHRLASDGSEKGIGRFCLEWAFGQCGHLRIDTHPDNRIMQKLAQELGFVRCGTIYVAEDDFPRIAYERT